MKVESVALSSLREDLRNVRVHSKRNMEAIRNSLEAFGQQKPLVVTHDGMIVAGNGTFAAARGLAWEQINVVRLPKEWTSEQITAFAIADNRTSELGEWDYGVLVDTLGNLDDELVAAAGWDDAGLKFLLDPPDNDEPAPAPNNAGVKESYQENYEQYEDAETRSILLDFPLEEYVRVTSQLEKAREAYNVGSNAEAIRILLNKYLEAE